jgi:glycosyltransferase involved in cell wall biosynthesis
MKKYSVVIATLDRAKDLKVVLDCLSAQTIKPEKVIISDASSDSLTKELISTFIEKINIEYWPSATRSSAIQRNEGAQRVDTPIISFMDDDIEFESNLFERLLPSFEDDTVGGVSPCQEGLLRKDPGFLIWLYYFLQAGYYHPTYGGQVFGPGINVYPFRGQTKDDFINSNWLPATLLVLRKELFEKYRFPDFHEYSFAEDVYLTHQISKENKLAFASQLSFKHYSKPSSFKSDQKKLIKMKLDNMLRVGREVLLVNLFSLKLKFAIHKVFLTVVYISSARTRSLIKYLW